MKKGKTKIILILCVAVYFVGAFLVLCVIPNDLVIYRHEACSNEESSSNEGPLKEKVSDPDNQIRTYQECAASQEMVLRIHEHRPVSIAELRNKPVNWMEMHGANSEMMQAKWNVPVHGIDSPGRRGVYLANHKGELIFVPLKKKDKE
jgi:hypothetical protein